MTNEKNPYIGSSFDDFLVEESISNRVEELSIKKALALGLQQFMAEEGVTKTDLAERLHTSRSQLDRLLDPNNEALTLSSMRQAADVMGKKLIMALE